MKTTRASILALAFILSGFGSTIISNSLFAQPQKTVAVVIVKTLSVTQAPAADSPMILKLREGDSVEVLAKDNGFYKIRYKLEGDFPVEGFVPEGALAGARPEDLDQFRQRDQSYKAEVKDKPVLPPTALPTLPTEVTRPVITAQKPGATAATMQREVEHKRSEGPWFYEAHASVGYSELKESLKTKAVDTSGTPYGDPFLTYELPGLRFNLEGRFGRENESWDYGILADYAMTLFRGVVANSSAGFDPKIDAANAQATRHEIYLGGYLAKTFDIRPKFRLRPEIKLLPYFYLHSVNQLKSQDNLRPGVSGQSVLYSQMGYGAILEISPQLYMPFNLRFTPMIGVTVLSMFTESPIQTSSAGTALAESETRRTGSPKMGMFQIHYGADLSFNMKGMGWETINLVAAYRMMNVSQTFSGQGNRAGMKMLDTKSDSTLTSYSFGIEYLF